MPNFKYLKRSIQRIRKIDEAVPVNPQTLHFKIPEQFKLTLDGKKFLLYENGDIGTYDDQILLFSINKNLNLLKNSEH
jgi:hypothetical protein